MAKLSEVEKELAETQKKLSADRGGESWSVHSATLPTDACSPCVTACLIPPLRLLRLFHRGPAGRLYDRSAERGSDGRRGAQEAPRARGRLAQGRSEAPQAGGTHAARPDAFTAARVRHGATFRVSDWML